MTYAILAGAAALTIATGSPAGAVQESDNRGTAKDWSDSGWATSGQDRAPHVPGKSKGSAAGTKSAGGSSKEGTPIPEPSNLLMLMLGLAGLVAGRAAARRRKKL